MIKWNEIYASPCLGSKNAFAMPTSWSSEWTDWTASSYMLMVFIHYYLPSTTHTHTREMALNIWHWGDPKKNFNWEKNWQSIHFAFLRGVDKYIIIHAHGHQPQEEKLVFKKWQAPLLLNCVLGLVIRVCIILKRKIPLFLRISKFSIWGYFATCRLFILWK